MGSRLSCEKAYGIEGEVDWTFWNKQMRRKEEGMDYQVPLLVPADIEG